MKELNQALGVDLSGFKVCIVHFVGWVIVENGSDFFKAFWKLFVLGLTNGFYGPVRLDEFHTGFRSNTLDARMEIGANHNGEIDQLSPVKFIFIKHFIEHDFLSLYGSSVAFRTVAHQVANQEGRSVEEGIPVLCSHNIKLAFGRHHRCLAFAFCFGIDPRHTKQIEQLLGFSDHLWRIVHDSLCHFLSEREITRCEGFLVNPFGLQTSCFSLSNFICFQIWSRSIKHEHWFDSCSKHGGGAIEKAHQVRYNFTIFCPQWASISLWRTVSHRGEELKRCKERINANPLARKVGQIDGLRRGDVTEVAAHGNSIGYGYVVVRIRTRQEVRARALTMARHVACLRGWHPALARAEIAALLPGLETEPLRGRRLLGMNGNATLEELTEAVEVSSGCQAILCDAIVWHYSGEASFDAFIEEVVDHLQSNRKNGSVAVRAWRHEGRIEGLGPSRLAQRIGGRLHDLGYAIDLNSPDHRFGVVVDASSSTVACGWMVGFGDESDGVSTRKAAERPFFKPVSLDPRLARLAVNLASGPIHKGTTVDLMTGTGGFLIEAALSGRSSVGLDLDEMMVEGAKENLEWALEQAGHSTHDAVIVQGDATALESSLPAGKGPYVGFVLDPPYGRNSQGSLAPVELLQRVLDSSSKNAAKDAGLVLILPIQPMTDRPDDALLDTESVDVLHGTWQETAQALSDAGFIIQARYVEHVHASLSRLILHATIAPQG